MEKKARKKSRTISIDFTISELEAAFLACSNYTPKDKKWKQRTQSRVATKLREALLNMILT